MPSCSTNCCQAQLIWFILTQGPKLTACIPSPVYAFARVLEVQLNALVNETSVARHDHSPPCVTSSHAGHIEAFLPFLVDPFEGEAI